MGATTAWVVSSIQPSAWAARVAGFKGLLSVMAAADLAEVVLEELLSRARYWHNPPASAPGRMAWLLT